MRVWTWIWMAAAALGVLVPRAALADDFVYDGANRLVKTVKAGLVTTYGYDGEGNLVRECSGPTESALTCSDVLMDAGELPKVLGKVTGSNEKLYAHGPEGVAAQRAVNGGAAQAAEYMLADHQGTVRGVTDGAGTVQARLAYDAYGAVRTKTGTSVPDLGYTGEYTGADGVVNLRARSYLPMLGRFLQRDTYVLGGSTTQGLNRYAYVSNNPLKFTDPSGHSTNIRARDVQDALRQAARRHIGSMDWRLSVERDARGVKFLNPSNKCNQFIFEVIAGANEILARQFPLSGQAGFITNPRRKAGLGGPISADKWDDNVPGWTRVENPQIGDIAVDGEHIGIVTGLRETTSAASGDEKGVVENGWGFRASERQVRFYRLDLITDLINRDGRDSDDFWNEFTPDDPREPPPRDSWYEDEERPQRDSCEKCPR